MNNKRGESITLQRKKMPNEEFFVELTRFIALGQRVAFTVRGNSMNPFLVDHRDKVLLAPFSKDQLKPGVVVLARCSTGNIVLHRIIDRNGDQLILMGDGNVKGTEQTSVLEVLGVMAVAIRKEKEYFCEAFVWKCYSSIWMKLLPLRKWPLGLFRKMNRISR